MITLVLGGARSGKSRYAEQLLAGQAAPIYLATGQSFDDEMRQRIALHKERRGAQWQTIEEPLFLAGVLTRLSRRDNPILVDCLTLWLSNLMGVNADVSAACDHLLQALEALPGDVVLVSNEVGFGIVPGNKVARDFRDHAGILHQRIAAIADKVVFVAAGLPLILKGV